MGYKITMSEIGPISLNETDTVKSILQNVSIILRTIKGSCPMYRGFEEYEPRVRVKSVDFDTRSEMQGALIPIVEVEIVNEP